MFKRISEVKVAQLGPSLCDPMNYRIHGILQARMLKCVAFPFSRGLPNTGIEPGSPALQADSLPTELSIRKSSPLPHSKTNKH